MSSPRWCGQPWRRQHSGGTGSCDTPDLLLFLAQARLLGIMHPLKINCAIQRTQLGVGFIGKFCP